MKQTTAQLVFEKYDEFRWIEFCIWIKDNRKELLKHSKEDVEYSHFHGSLNQQSSADYYRATYDILMDKIMIINVWGNGTWIYRLNYNGEVIKDFVSFDEALGYAKTNYDRATDTIKKN